MICIVDVLRQSGEENFESKLFLDTITQCRCPNHLNENPSKSPTIKELNKDLRTVIQGLLEYGSSVKSRELLTFIMNNCLANTPSSLLTITSNLEEIEVSNT